MAKRKVDVDHAVNDLRRRLLDAGKSSVEADSLLTEAVLVAADAVAPGLFQAMMRKRRFILREYQHRDEQFVKRLHKTWGKPLDLMYLAIISTTEMTEIFIDREKLPEHLASALVNLSSRAARVSREVHSLLSQGYPLGALARSRTLYEISVISAVLVKYDGTPGNEDLAERYELHHTVTNREDARIYQRDYQALGLDALDENDWNRIEQEHDRLKARFGPKYLHQTGWAYPLIANPTAGIGDLEKLLGLGHQRGYYRWASHEVHADTKSGVLNQFTRGDLLISLRGRTNIMLEDPATLTLESLKRVSESLCLSRYARATDFAALAAVELMIIKANREFIKAGKKLSAREGKYQAKYAKRKARDARS